MANSFWQFGDELRGHARAGSEEQTWTLAASKLAQMRGKSDRINIAQPSFDSNNNTNKYKGKSEPCNDKMEFLNSKLGSLSLNTQIDFDWKIDSKSSNYNNANMNSYHNVSNNNNNNNNNGVSEKRFKTLPSTEMLPRSEILGGYIFVCNNDTMQEDLKRQLFGLPQRYRDSVRAITPGLPLFLYNYTTHQLHGIFEAASFGGSNIDPTAWEDKKCRGESRFPAQVKIRVRKVCKPLEEDAFRPVLHHYDGPKFRLQLSVPETLALMDLCMQNSL